MARRTSMKLTSDSQISRKSSMALTIANLESIKAKYDPFNLFYAVTAIGSDFWEPQEDGRLCKAKRSDMAISSAEDL